MQYAVPQFTDVEDKLIGPLTLKQFFAMLATGGIVMFFWSLLGMSLFFFLFAVPTALLGLGLTFGKYNERPLFTYTAPFISFFSKPQVRIFKREEPDMFEMQIKPQEVKKEQRLEASETESRLRKLAYLLDQKAAEEDELIGRK